MNCSHANPGSTTASSLNRGGFAAVLGYIGHGVGELVAKRSREVQHSLSEIGRCTTHPTMCPHIEIDEKVNVHVQVDEVVLSQSGLAVLPPVIERWTIRQIARIVLLEGGKHSRIRPLSLPRPCRTASSAREYCWQLDAGSRELPASSLLRGVLLGERGIVCCVRHLCRT